MQGHINPLTPSHPIFWRFILILFSHLCLHLPSGLCLVQLVNLVFHAMLWYGETEDFKLNVILLPPLPKMWKSKLW
jgi:hypothetical protein